MGAGGFHGRVRDGIGCGLPAMATRSSNPSAWAAQRRPFGWVNEVLVRLVCDVLCCGGWPTLLAADQWSLLTDR